MMKLDISWKLHKMRYSVDIMWMDEHYKDKFKEVIYRTLKAPPPGYIYGVCVHVSLGSMPPHSTQLWEEGMCVKSFMLVKNGIFQEEG